MTVKVIGGGLAGAEAAYQLAKRGVTVELYEMRPVVPTPVHKGGGIAELVCSNSLKSVDPDTAQGVLKEELKLLDSAVVRAAYESRVPAGGALAVDRNLFSSAVESILKNTNRVTVIREEVTRIEDNSIIATGPLTSDGMGKAIAELVPERLYFYDAAAPIVTAASIDPDKSFFAARYGKGDADYLNCPLNEEEYGRFREELIKAEKVIAKDFEKGELFEGCMPIEELAARGRDAMRFGPLRPVGIFGVDGKRAYAIVQLRKEDNYEHLYNLVGFQTNLKFPEQKRVFSMIPALKNAEFVRYGVMHRNTYVRSPGFLNADFSVKGRENLFFAGQITGVEGYLESAASGLIAGMSMAEKLSGRQGVVLPETTVIGGLQRYVSGYSGNFQPMHVSFMLLPQIEGIRDKSLRKRAYSERAIADLKKFIADTQTAGFSAPTA